MKNNKLRIAAFAVAIAVVGAGAFAAFADQENNFDSPCAHSYQVTAFADNTAMAQCEHCGDVQSFCFADSVGDEADAEGFVEALDVNTDGIINGRDLAYLKSLS